MDIYEIRVENLRRLLSFFPKTEAFAEVAGTSAVYISQILSPKTKANMGNGLAKKITLALNLPLGFLDVPHTPDEWIRLQSLNLDWSDGKPSRKRRSALDAFESDEEKELFDAGQKDGKMMMKTTYLIRPSHLDYIPLDDNFVPSRKVPVVGTVQGGDDGYFVELEHPTGFGDGFLPHFTKDGNAYGLRVKGDSMAPRICSGEYIIAEPNTSISPGDEVVVKLVDGRRMVKTFLYSRDGEITLSSVNEGHKPITVPESDVLGMHYVAAVMRRGAFIHD